MNSIRKKITVCLMATVLVALFAVGAASIILNYRSTIVTVDQLMSQTAVLAAERIEEELNAYKNVAMDTGRISQLASGAVSKEEKKAIIDERVSLHGFQRGNVIGMNGISIFDGKDYSDREYVQQAMKGNVYVRAPGQQDHRRAVHHGGRPHLLRPGDHLRRGLLRAPGDLLKRHCLLY